MSEMNLDISAAQVDAIIQKLTFERGENDQHSDEFLSSIIEACHCDGIHRTDSEFFLQERYGNDPEFTELFDDVWTECENGQGLYCSVSSDSALANTPFVPTSVYAQLPVLLLKGSEAFEDQRQKDVFLIGALSVLSSLLDTVQGVYANEIVSPVLYMFVLAPAASGKSALKQSALLARKVHEEVRQQSESELQQYRMDKRDYDRKSKSDKNDPGEPPSEPKYQVHLVPANSSRASIISMLDSNRGRGLIFDTEADSLTKSFASEWGDFSELIRKGFHHEPITSARKTNGEYIEVERPCFSICLSGTPDQVINLVQSAENGMFSRLGFYAFSSPCKWISPAPDSSKRTYNEVFDALGQDALEMYRYFRQDTFMFELQLAHWDTFNRNFSEKLELITAIYGDEAASVIKRLGLICYRIAMVLSAIRHFEENKLQSMIICDHECFMAALSISNTLMEHGLLVLDKLPRSSKSKFDSPDSREEFFNCLPQSFTRQQAQSLAREKSIGKKRTVDALLASWADSGRLTKPMKGKFVKP